MAASTPEITAGPRTATGRGIGSFAGDVMKLASGTGTAQLIGVLAAPFLARLFAPEAFGTLALFASFTSVIGVIVCLRYELSIVLPEKDEDAASAAALCLLLVCVITALTAVLVFLPGASVIKWTHAHTLHRFIWLLPLSVFVTGVMVVLNAWTVRKRLFGRLTVVQVVDRFCNTGLQLALGLAGFVTGGALIGATLIGGLLVPASILLTLTWHDSGRILLAGFRWEGIKYAFRRYSRFPKYSTSSAVLSTLAGQAPVLLLGGQFSARAAGQYAMGARLLRVPIGLIGVNFSRAIFPRAAEAKNRGILHEPVENAFRQLVNIMMLPCVLLTFCGKDIFTVVFGQRWSDAGLYCQILGAWLFFWFLAAPLNNVLLVLEEQALELRFQILVFTTRVLSLLGGGLFHSAKLGLVLMSVTGTVVYSLYSGTILQKAGVSVTAMARHLIWRFLLCTPAAMLIILLKVFGAPAIAVVVIASLLIALHCASLVRANPAARRKFGSLLSRTSPATPEQSSAQGPIGIPEVPIQR